MKGTIFILSIIFIIQVCSCEHEPNPLEPVEDTTVVNKEFTWSIDTLKHPYGGHMVPTGIWGSSPTDVWAVGFNDVWEGEIWHYDGIRWERKTAPYGLYKYDIRDVYGFAKDNVLIEFFAKLPNKFGKCNRN